MKNELLGILTCTKGQLLSIVLMIVFNRHMLFFLLKVDSVRLCIIVAVDGWEM